MSATYNPTLLEAGVRANFLLGLQGADSQSYIPLTCSTIASNKSSEEYAWIGESPAMSTWTGTAKYTPMSDKKYTLANTKYQAGIVVDFDDMRDDQVGGLDLRAQQLGAGVVSHQNSLAINALVNGTTNTGHDAVAFFSNSHTARGQMSAVNDNIIAGTGTTTAQFQTDITSAIVQMLGFEAENGNQFHQMLSELLVVAHPTVLGNLEEAVNATIVSNTSNVRFAKFRISTLYTALPSDTNDWYLLNTAGPLKPLIYQTREAVSLERQDDFDLEQHKFKLRGRYAVGYGHYANAVKVTNT